MDPWESISRNKWTLRPDGARWRVEDRAGRLVASAWTPRAAVEAAQRKAAETAGIE